MYWLALILAFVFCYDPYESRNPSWRNHANICKCGCLTPDSWCGCRPIETAALPTVEDESEPPMWIGECANLGEGCTGDTAFDLWVS